MSIYTGAHDVSTSGTIVVMLNTPLHVALSLGLIGLIAEISALLFRSKLIRRTLYGSMIVVTAPAAVLLLAYDFRLGTAIVAVVAVFRIIGGLRVIVGRIKEVRLGPASRRTTLFLVLYQIVALILWRTGVVLELEPWAVINTLAAVSFLAGIVIILSSRRNLSRTKIRPSDKYVDDSELPTVSVCIPARNETIDLPACLELVLKSDYPKLEVLVLDDCSQDRTSEIIKGFAQKGVRFIRGEEPKNGWLAKNQAYQALAEAASGELLMFIGVDARLERGAIRALVGTISARNKSMISILPRGLQTSGADVLVQPMRYWWELALPRRLFNRPPVLSTTWMITRQALFRLGEFKAARGSVLPEAYFARQLARTDEYSFMRASGKLAISSAKSFADQWETAVRMRYPEARQRPENVIIGALAQLLLLGLPLGIFLTGFFVPLGYLWLVGGTNALMLFYVHYQISKAWGVSDNALPVVLLPVSLILELVNLHVSMYKYEFSEVVWKERNICIPVMQRYPKLPPA